LNPVAAGAACGVAAAAFKGGTFEALTAARAAFTGTAATWGYTNKAEGMKDDGPGAHRYPGRWGALAPHVRLNSANKPRSARGSR
jgi:hypothetical protein